MNETKNPYISTKLPNDQTKSIQSIQCSQCSLYLGICQKREFFSKSKNSKKLENSENVDICERNFDGVENVSLIP